MCMAPDATLAPDPGSGNVTNVGVAEWVVLAGRRHKLPFPLPCSEPPLGQAQDQGQAQGQARQGTLTRDRPGKSEFLEMLSMTLPK